jgi:hypothetical protein
MFDRLAICEAYFIFLSRNHEGQGSDKYRRLSKMWTYFKPAMGLEYGKDPELDANVNWLEANYSK